VQAAAIESLVIPVIRFSKCVFLQTSSYFIFIYTLLGRGRGGKGWWEGAYHLWQFTPYRLPSTKGNAWNQSQVGNKINVSQRM